MKIYGLFVFALLKWGCSVPATTATTDPTATSAIKESTPATTDSTGSTASTSNDTSASSKTAEAAISASAAIGDIVTQNKLALAYPGGLALTIFPSSVDAALALRLSLNEESVPEEPTTIEDASVDTAPDVTTNATATGVATSIELPVQAPVAPEDLAAMTYNQKVVVASNILSGNVDSCIPESEGKNATPPLEENCYQFDQEMLFAKPYGDKINGSLDGKSISGGACLVAFAKSKVASVEKRVDSALTMLQSMMCQAKKDKAADSLPKKDADALDLKDSMATIMPNGTISKATIKRLDDDANGSPVYQTDVTITLPGGSVQEMHLMHSPKAEDDNSTYHGVLWTRTVSSTSLALNTPLGPPNPPLEGNHPQPGGNNNQPSDPYLSVEYARVLDAKGEHVIQARLLSANVVNALGDLAFVKGVLDLNMNTNEDGDYLNPDTQEAYGMNEAVSGITYIAFNMNDDGSGTTSYWQNPGSNYQENARGMVFKLAKNENGELEGCGNSGATSASPNDALSIRKSFKTKTELVPLGFYHPTMSTEGAQNITQGSCVPELTGAETSVGDFVTEIFAEINANADTENYLKSFKSLTDTTLKYTTCSESGQSSEWIAPVFVDEAQKTLAKKWSQKQMDSIISRQCVKQDSDGAYQIDETKVTEQAGFLLYDTTGSDDSYVIDAPDLSLLGGSK